MIQGPRAIALLAAMVLGLVDLIYIRLATGPSQSGPTPIALLFMTMSALSFLGGATLPWRRARVVLLAVTSVASVSLAMITFPIGLGLMVGGLVGAGATLGELGEGSTAEDSLHGA